jgi:transcriptional regulator with XRE-family HTH domain
MKNTRRPRKDIINARLAIGMTQTELAKRSGMDHGLLSKIEAGHRGLSVKSAPAIAKVLGLDVITLLYPPPPDPDVERTELLAAIKKHEETLAELRDAVRENYKRRRRQLQRERNGQAKEAPETEVA